MPLPIDERPEITRIFGPDLPVVLEVVDEPAQEEDEDLTEVMATIRTGQSSTDARLLPDRFDQAWWVPNGRRCDGRMRFVVRYR